VKVFEAKVTDGQGPAGEILAADGGLRIAAGGGRGAVEVLEVQPAGKARMTTGDWLRGARLTPGGGRRFV
jgi:methionyl-tRNA formyltransferase